MCLIFNTYNQYTYLYFYLYVFNKYNFCNIFKIILCLLNTYLIAALEKFQILKNGSDYQGAWPPLYYIIRGHGETF